MAGGRRRLYFSEDEDEYENETVAINMPVNRTKQYQQKRWATRPWWQQVSIHTCSASSSVPFSSFSTSSSFSSPFASKLSTLLRLLSIPKRRLRFEPHDKLYFPYEPGKQSTSAVRIENISGDPIAFKFQTTVPKSCFMRPPGGVLDAGESIIAIVVRYMELAKSPTMASRANHNAIRRKTLDKFKIVTVKVEDGVEFTPELFDKQKELVRMERILQVVLLDPNRPSPQLHNLKGLLEERDVQAAKKMEERKPSPKGKVSDVNVLEEWKQQKLARKELKGRHGSAA